MGNFDRTRWFNTALKMDITTWLSLLLAVITLGTPVSSSEPRVVCYYTNWSVYRPGTARFNPQNINPYLCTHLIYAFGGFTKDNTLKPFDKYQDIEKGGYAKFTGLKTYNKNLKTLLAIGGWNEASSRFSPMVGSRDRRKEFVRNAIKFLRQNRFDGLDLDWEYPAFREGGKPKDRENYAKLVKELREEFNRESEKTGKPRLLLTMAVPAGIEYIEKGFDVKTLNRYLDWMNLLSYDYHSAFEPAVNHHAPLYPLEEPNEYSVDNELNIDYTIKFYLESGADPNKLVLGIPTYGRSYTLFNADAVEIGSPADGPGEQGDATREKGYLAYYEICEALKPKSKKRQVDSEEEEESEEYSDEEEEDEPWTVMYPNPDAMGPVAYRGTQWVGYDDVDIVKKKAAYVAENGLGGIMFWSIDNDDFRGTCHGKPYPLIEAAKEVYFAKIGSTDNATAEKKTAVSRPSNRRKNRPKPKSTTTTSTTTPKPSNKNNKRKNSLTSTTPTWNIITPEPPTTPDPGSDFKCVDEGFYPHPRDCKKYFWCLDSGPSDLGIVAHQFTCPSGLYFNKAADSCDFARNVPCKKNEPTTKAPTTKASTTKASTTTTTTTTTTTPRPVRLSTKSSSLFRTTSSTTPQPEREEEYEVESTLEEDDAEDPKVIKELIDLIKKVGGIEQLEKQLLGENTPSVSTDGGSTTTPSSFNKKLYQKVLEKTRGKNKYPGSILETLAQNSRRGPQNAGIQPASDRDKLLRKDRPQYTTINRQRTSTTTTTQESDASEELFDDSEEQIKPVYRGEARVVQATVATTAKTLQYVNIRRARPTSGTSDTADNSDSRNALFEREPYATDTPNSLDILSARKENTPEYVTIRRQRPTTQETTTVQYQESDERVELQESALEKEISSQPQYTSIVRSRSTTPISVDEPNSSDPIFRFRSTTISSSAEQSSPEPTTVLSVQISSLLNSPSSSEIESTIVTTPAVTTEVVEPTTISTSRPTTTTTTTTTAAPPSSTSRRIALRRRGPSSSTVTTAAPQPSSTIQVSPRNYTVISRRRPLARPNEISSESNESVEVSRKIRSTTPDSREVDGDRGVTTRRFRSRFQVTRNQTDDSVPAAASIPRGQLRPLSPDGLISLTPVDVEPEFVPNQTSNVKTERRYRGRPSTSTIVVDTVPDSEASAATIDARRPSILPRGRSRFTISSTTETSVQLASNISSLTQKRPTFARFTARPFTRPTPTSDNENSDTKESVVTRRTLTRLAFGKSRPSPAASPVIQARKLPFRPRQTITTTTQEPRTDDDEEPENRKDDISLSESAIEEKEHDDTTEPVEEAPKRRFIIKKLRVPESVSETISTEAIPIDDSGKKRFKVIRRRPTSTTSATEMIASTEGPTIPVTVPGYQRVRKIVRKKLKLAEDNPEITAKLVGNLNAIKTSTIGFNYGEKTKTPPISTTTTTTESATEPITEVFEAIKEGSNIDWEAQEEHYENREQINEAPVEEKEEKHEENVLETTTSSTTTTFVDAKFESKSKVKTESKETQDKSESETNLETSDDEPIPTENANLDPDINTEVESKGEIETIETEVKPEVAIETEDKSIDFVENKETTTESSATETESPQTETTTTSTTLLTSPSGRTRLPYRPRKKLFTSTTESSASSSSKIFSRKFNPGVYTSPATVERSPFKPSVTRRPFSSKIFTRRPFTTARTTQGVGEGGGGEEYNDEEILVEEREEPEEENPLVFVPANQLFTKKPYSFEYSDDENADTGEVLEDGEEEIEEEEEIKNNENRFTTRKPGFKPRVVNSYTFRTSTSTTALPKSFGTQNRTGVVTRLGSNKPSNDTKKRVQNVPIGYNSPVNAPRPKFNTLNTVKNETQNEEATTTNASVAQTDTIATTDDDYLTMTSTILPDNKELTTDIQDILSTNTVETETVTQQMEVDNSTDDYLTYTEGTTNYPTTQDITTIAQTEPEIKTSVVQNIYTDTVSNTEAVTETPTTTTTTTTNAPVSPIIKTQFDKLFSISRVVEVSSKLDKHRVNKNNETTHIEEGKIMIEKKPVIDKIGEVSRYSLIKIVEDEIPIYLTKLGHVYPVENPPDNIIRIDEARNARALETTPETPKENLVASESVNEAYRHIKHVVELSRNGENKGHVEHVINDDFLTYINEDSKNDEVENDKVDPLYTQWQFVPAAYENEKLKSMKTLDIITPRSMLTKPSTLSLEGLFKTENPITARKVSDEYNQPFVVYSESMPNQNKNVNIVKLELTKPETGRSIKTFAKGQEFNGGSFTDTTVKYPTSVSIITQETESTTSNITTTTTTVASSTTTTPQTEKSTSPIIQLLSPTLSTTESSTVPTTNIPSTTEIVTEETTTLQSPLDAKRAKFALPRRPIIKSSNLTRLTALRTAKKINSTVISNLNKKANKTTFSPSKSRFTGNRVQNLPIDIKKKGITPRAIPKSYTTGSPKTTTERNLYVIPLRPSFRPAFGPRRTTPTLSGDT